jgi:hypothetical protein
MKDQLNVSAFALVQPKTAEAPSSKQTEGFRRKDEALTAINKNM